MVLESNVKAKNSQGIIKWFNAKLRYGFIKDSDGKEYFFHHSNWLMESFPKTGIQVNFQLLQGKKGPYAGNVDVIDILKLNKNEGNQTAKPATAKSDTSPPPQLPAKKRTTSTQNIKRALKDKLPQGKAKTKKKVSKGPSKKQFKCRCSGCKAGKKCNVPRRPSGDIWFVGRRQRGSFGSRSR